MNAVVRIEDATPSDQPETTAILAVIERAASNPAVDIDKMERLLQMQERVLAKRAETEFAAALAEMQSELPVIGERGSIKDRSGGVQSTYALWEDVNDAIKPVMQKFGFALSFRVAERDSKTIVTGVLSHKSGHRETTDITLPADTSGSKNAVQAIGSSVSYGKRYAAAALLNLTSHGEDDDGKAAGKKTKPAQVAGTPRDGMRVEDFDEQKQIIIRENAGAITEYADAGQLNEAMKAWRDITLPNEEKAAIWFLLPSHHRTAINRLLKR